MTVNHSTSPSLFVAVIHHTLPHPSPQILHLVWRLEVPHRRLRRQSPQSPPYVPYAPCTTRAICTQHSRGPPLRLLPMLLTSNWRSVWLLLGRQRECGHAGDGMSLCKALPSLPEPASADLREEEHLRSSVSTPCVVAVVERPIICSYICPARVRHFAIAACEAQLLHPPTMCPPHRR